MGVGSLYLQIRSSRSVGFQELRLGGIEPHGAPGQDLQVSLGPASHSLAQGSPRDGECHDWAPSLLPDLCLPLALVSCRHQVAGKAGV